MDSENLHKEIDKFTRHLDALIDSSPMIMAISEVARVEAAKAFNEYLENHGEKNTNEDGTVTYALDGEYDRVAARKKRNVDRVEASYKLIPQSLIVSLVSEFDAFLGNLLKVIYSAKPELLNSSDRQLKFSELSEFETIDEARTFVLEKEIESILRQSHADQFKTLENRFDLKLTKGLDIWPDFIELTERRNLYVHTSGIVSRQYRIVCGRHGVKLSEQHALGRYLTLDRKYLAKAYRCLYEIGFKLTHVLWRKVFPNDRERADDSLNDIIYELLIDGRYKFAKKLLDFSLQTIKMHHDEATKRVLMINRAIAYKFSGETEEAVKIVDSVDWTALSDEYQLAVAVIKDDDKSAFEIMRRIGPEGKIGKIQYKEWPLFRDFRLTPEFSDVYKEIFLEDFKVIEEVKSVTASMIESVAEEKKKASKKKASKKKASKKKASKKKASKKKASKQLDN